MTLHIVGLDLSFTNTGWAIIRPGEGIRHGLVSTPAIDPANYYPLTLDRIRRISSRSLARIRDGREPGDPMVVAFEAPSYGSKGGQEHARGGLWWLLYHLISKEADLVITIPPKSAKSYMGNGNYDKPAMVAAVQRAFPERLITDDNEADALTLAAMVARQCGMAQEQSVQRVRPSALDGVRWPDALKDVR